MISIKYRSICAVAIIYVSAARAREVDLVHFSPSAVVASNEQGAVGAALSTHFEGLVKSIDATGPSYFFEPTHRGILATFTSASCLQSGYRPTWWLPAEVEKRRATYFEAMSQIACENDLPVSLLDAVVAQESGYKAWAISGAGAMGMMQVMPGTAKHLGLWNPWDALANLRAGARYLRQQLDRFGRVDLALAAYNAGPERRSEPPRDCRRPQLLRGRACYEQYNQQVCTGGASTCGAHGAGSRS